MLSSSYTIYRIFVWHGIKLFIVTFLICCYCAQFQSYAANWLSSLFKTVVLEFHIKPPSLIYQISYCVLQFSFLAILKHYASKCVMLDCFILRCHPVTRSY